MENLFIILTLVSLVCFLLSWITPNKFSPLFKNKLSKGKIRLVFGLSVIVFFVLFGITSDSKDSKTKKEEPVVSQEKSEVANLPENKQEASQEDIKKEEISEVEEKDFSVYDEFFSLRATQLKRVDQVVNNLSVSRHQELIKSDSPATTKEYDMVWDAQIKLGDFEEKLDENNKLHKIITEAIDFYSDYAGSCKNWLILLPSSLKFSDWINFKLSDNAIVEQMPKECGLADRESGDQKIEELLSLLKEKGYKNSISSVNNSKKQETPVSQTKSYKQVFSFSGGGAKNSETFTITGSKFRIKYDCIKTTMTPLCQAVLRSPNDESLYKEIFNTTGETQSETVFYEKGTFYIEATVMGGEFDIIVEEYK